MKRTLMAGCSLALLFGIISLPAVTSAQSAFDKNVGGCGLGSMIVKESDTVLFQVLAVTTNGILGNQTFGISSGTLECKQPSKFVNNEKLNRFVAENMDPLAQDIATGGGESLDTLAELISIPVEKRPEFYAALQANFKKIYASTTVQSADVIDNIVTVKAD